MVFFKFVTTVIVLCEYALSSQLSKQCMQFATNQKQGQSCLTARREVFGNNSQGISEACAEMYDKDWGIDL
jgi:hypothetical protein